MDPLLTVLTCASVCIWGGAVSCEYALSTHPRLVPPCQIVRENPGYAFVFVGLPVALLFYVKMQLAQGLVGALGLLAVGEAAVVLAVNGVAQLESFHGLFVLFTLLFSALFWANLSPALALVVAGPQVLLGGLLGLRTMLSHCTIDYTDPVRAGLFWAAELWYIASHTVWMLPGFSPADFDHWGFDAGGAVGLGALMLLLIAGARVYSKCTGV
jgi:hypothetical protein